MMQITTKTAVYGALALAMAFVLALQYYLTPVDLDTSSRVALLSSKAQFMMNTTTRLYVNSNKKLDDPVTGQGRRDSGLANTTTSARLNDPSSPSDNQHNPRYHVVFSTSCSEQQHWESFVFFYHARKIRQPGNVTRIVSGCKEKDEAWLRRFHEDYIAPMSDDDGHNSFHVHFTPNFSRERLARGRSAYKYMNKPYGLRHWMEESLGLHQHNFSDAPREILDSIVILMDPDMVLLRPIRHDYTKEEVIWVEPNATNRATSVVRHGHPIAQQDGYLSNDWMKLNMSYITNLPEGSFVPRPPWKEGRLYWNTGPPYLATVQDMYKIAISWTEYAPRVLDIHPKLFAEMFGFIHATVQLRLPFTLIKSLVVSTTHSSNREGWEYVDALSDKEICATPPTTPISTLPSTKLPVALHYCKRYLNGRWFFSKYRLKKNIMDCDKALLRVPPQDLVGMYDYGVFPPRADLKDKGTFKEERIQLSARILKREAYMLCGMTRAVNEAFAHHKKRKCGGTANLNETYFIFTDPSSH